MKIPRRVWLCFAVLLAVLTASGSAEAKIGVSGANPDYFPLEKGNTWLYEANVAFLVKKNGKNEPDSAKLTWKMEVMETLERGNLFAARLRGFPTELAWYEPGRTPGEYVIVRAGSASFYLFGVDEAPGVWAKLKEERQSLGDLDGELFLDAPLIVGKMWGGTLGNYESGRYCRVVNGAWPFDPKSVKGAPALQNAMEFGIAYQAAPEHFDFSFVPGLGITSYNYSHHGTLSEASVRLVEFHRAAAASTPK